MAEVTGDMLTSPKASIREVSKPVTKSDKLQRVENSDSARHALLEMIDSGQEGSQDIPSILQNKQEVVDKDGKRREFYEISLPSGERTHVIFKDREEVIDPTAFSDKHIVHLGKDPKWLPMDKYDAWKKQFSGKDGFPRMEGQIQPHSLDSYSQQGGLTFIVDQGAESIAEMALLLGATDPLVRAYYHEARTYQYSDNLIAQIDQAIAARVVTEDGTIDVTNTSKDGEALLLASFVGDEAARSILERKGKTYREYEEKSTEKRKQEAHGYVAGRADGMADDPNFKDAEPLKVDELVVVHATKFYPEFNKDIGKWVIKTLYDSTDGYAPRTSIHTALNHVVVSHGEGSWEEAPIIIAVPLKDMIDENGNPTVLNTIDTFWDLNPGQDLVLPDSAKVLAPGSVPEGATQGPAPESRLNHRGIIEGRQAVNYRSYDTSTLQQLRHVYRPDKTHTIFQDVPEDELTLHRGLRDQVQAEISEVGKQRNTAVKEVLEGMGFEYKNAHTRDWSDEVYGLPNWRLSLLADKLGTQVSEHAVSPIGVVSERIDQVLTFIRSNQEDLAEQNRGVLKDYLSRNWSDVSAESKRLLWTYGML